MARLGRSKLPFVAAGTLALVALAAFLILDLGSGSVDPSSLPVISVGQGTAPRPGPGAMPTGSEQPSSTASAPRQPADANGPLPTSGTTAPATTTGSTVRETVNGSVRTGGPHGTGTGGGAGTTTGVRDDVAGQGGTPGDSSPATTEGG
jgi:hypothetical protein